MCVLVLMLINTGCILEGTKDCFTTALVYITVTEESGLDSPLAYSTSGNVDNATVYIFNHDSRLERVVHMSKEDIENRVPVEISYTSGRMPTVIVWGNLNGSQEISPVTTGMEISSASINLLQENGNTLPPDKLYYGYKELTTERVQEAPIIMWVGRLSTAVYGIEDVKNTADNYYFVIESECNGYDFYGKPKEGIVVMTVEGEVSEQQEEFLIHQPINLIANPASAEHRQTIVVKLYKRTDTGDQLLATADTDIEGNSIVPHSGTNTNVLINLAEPGAIGVNIVITPWDYIHQWVVW